MENKLLTKTYQAPAIEQHAIITAGCLASSPTATNENFLMEDDIEL